MKGWIAVDLDGTLAVYDGWVDAEHIGEPVPAMLFRVKKWLAEGKDVRILTARASGTREKITIERSTEVIQDWTEKHLGVRMLVTATKDFGMIELWDDRCVQVESNTGRRMDGKS